MKQWFYPFFIVSFVSSSMLLSAPMREKKFSDSDIYLSLLLLNAEASTYLEKMDTILSPALHTASLERAGEIHNQLKAKFTKNYRHLITQILDFFRKKNIITSEEAPQHICYDGGKNKFFLCKSKKERKYNAKIIFMRDQNGLLPMIIPSHCPTAYMALLYGTFSDSNVRGVIARTNEKSEIKIEDKTGFFFRNDHNALTITYYYGVSSDLQNTYRIDTIRAPHTTIQEFFRTEEKELFLEEDDPRLIPIMQNLLKGLIQQTLGRSGESRFERLIRIIQHFIEKREETVTEKSVEGAEEDEKIIQVPAEQEIIVEITEEIETDVKSIPQPEVASIERTEIKPQQSKIETIRTSTEYSLAEYLKSLISGRTIKFNKFMALIKDFFRDVEFTPVQKGSHLVLHLKTGGIITLVIPHGTKKGEIRKTHAIDIGEQYDASRR